MKNVRKNVEAILRVFPEARDNDRFLLLTYWKYIDRIDFDRFEESFLNGSATNPETIRRSRQMVQANGLYPATKPVHAARHAAASATKSKIIEMGSK